MSNERWAILLPALAISAWLAFTADEPAELASVALPPQHMSINGTQLTAGSRTSSGGSTNAEAADALQLLVPRDELLPPHASAERRNLFAATFWLAPAAPQATLDPDPHVLPSPFTYIGKLHDGTQWQIYLARGDETLLVTQDTTLDGLYKVEELAPPILKLLDLRSHHVQVLDIGAAE